MMNDIKFYDTSSLLLAGERIFEKKEKFLISSVTLKELEEIKTSSRKDADIKYAARLLLQLFNDKEYQKLFEVILHNTQIEDEVNDETDGLIYNFDKNNDLDILVDAIFANNNYYIDEVVFVTNDLALKQIASLFFGDDMIKSIEEDSDDYKGYSEIDYDLDTFAESAVNLYKDRTINHFNLNINEYLVLKDVHSNKVSDLCIWNGNEYDYLEKNLKFESTWFGKIVPKDIYQKMAFDSLIRNKITMLKGAAGTGKTLISLSFLMQQLEKHKIDKIIVFCNTVATVNSARLGFYPGTRDEKLLDSQIGNLLASKLGSREGVEQLIMNKQLVLLPLSDIRGYDTNGMRAGIYISEAQNLDKTLIKLALQRIGEDCFCIIDGDCKTQVDDIHFAGLNNGMKRVSKIFRNHDFYGEVELKNIYRSKIAAVAELI